MNMADRIQYLRKLLILSILQDCRSAVFTVGRQSTINYFDLDPEEKSLSANTHRE